MTYTGIHQRWAIDKRLDGATVYHYQKSGKPALYFKKNWKPQHEIYQALTQKVESKTARCQVDEFPMASLNEGRILHPQVCRLMNDAANCKRSTDFNYWLAAQ
jgi:chitinase